jgi:hypothetical protein
MQSFLKGAFHQKNIIKITFINSELSQKFGSKPMQQFEYNALKKGPGHQRKKVHINSILVPKITT